MNEVKQLLKDCKSYLYSKEYEDESGIVSSLLSRIDEELNKEYIFNPSIFNASFLTEEQRKEFMNEWFKTKADVILPIGTSGSGKSTFIKSLPQENLLVIEPDAMRVEFTGDMNDKSKDKEIYIEAANRTIQAIKQGKQVVFDTTNLTKDKRLPFIEAIKKAIPTANIQYKLMDLNPELAKQRIKAQLERGENRAAVSDETIDRHAASYKQMLEDIKNEPISNFEITPQQKATINIYASTNENADLSNFAIRPFTTNVETPSGDKQIKFQSLEQGFHYYKAMLADRMDIAEKVLKTTNGGSLRSLTNRRNMPMSEEQQNDWDSTSKSIMLNLMYDSYAQNPQAAEKLLATGDAKITHTQDNTRWKTDFPEVVMTVRDMLKEEGFKDGAAELFESNPELANSVYEALGLKTKDLFPIIYCREEEHSIDDLNQELDSSQPIQ